MCACARLFSTHPAHLKRELQEMNFFRQKNSWVLRGVQAAVWNEREQPRAGHKMQNGKNYLEINLEHYTQSDPERPHSGQISCLDNLKQLENLGRTAEKGFLVFLVTTFTPATYFLVVTVCILPDSGTSIILRHAASLWNFNTGTIIRSQLKNNTQFFCF